MSSYHEELTRVLKQILADTDPNAVAHIEALKIRLKELEEPTTVSSINQFNNGNGGGKS